MRCAALLVLLTLTLTLTLATTPIASEPLERTLIKDAAALRRLRGNSGLTLQWIGFETPGRGRLQVGGKGGLVHLKGEQRAKDGKGRLELEGDVAWIDARTFGFRGRIAITDTPDAGRRCVRVGSYEFKVTGQRRYWRLYPVEESGCDGLADYVDIYF